MSEEIEFNFPERDERPQPDTSGLLPVASFAQIGWMKRNVLALGGSLINMICRPTSISYPGVKYTISGETCGCGNDTLVLMPYKNIQGEDEEARLCLVCDGGMAWPRLESGEADAATDPPPFSA